MKISEIPGLLKSFAAISATECWLWPGTISEYGYGIVSKRAGVSRLAHRHAYEIAVGPIPAGLTIDHLCRNRRCINPAHLEPVSIGENVLRGEGISVQNRRKTHCKWGHALTPDNIIWLPPQRPTGNLVRRCATCRKIHNDKVNGADKARRAANPKTRRKTHCLRGHELAGDNLYLHPSGRQCRACCRIRKQSRGALR